MVHAGCLRNGGLQMKGILTKRNIALFAAVFFTYQSYIGGLILPNMYAAFPDLEESVVMLSYTFPLLLSSVVGLFMGAVIERINKRLFIILGLSGIVLGGGVITLLGNASFAFTMAGTILIGIGAAVTLNCSSLLLAQENPGKSGILVTMNSAVLAIGGMIISALAGILAVEDWTHAYYLCFPTALFLLVFLLLYRPPDGKETGNAPKSAAAAPAPAVKPASRTGLFLVILVIHFLCTLNQAIFLSYNASYIITDRSIGTTVETGMLATVGSFGNVIGGIFLAALLLPRLKRWTAPFGILLLMLPNLAMSLNTASMAVLYVSNAVSMAGLCLIFAPLSEAADKTLGPAGLNTFMAIRGLVSFVGPIIIQSVTPVFAGNYRYKFMIGVALCAAACLIAIPTMAKVEKL